MLRGVAVVDRALAVPALEHRLGGEPDLLVAVLRERRAGGALEDRLELARHPPPIVGSQLGVARHAGALRALSVSTSSNGSSASPSTTEPNICTRRR